MAARAEYGGNPHAGRNPNADNGWGGYQWPGGVPGNLLAVVTVPGGVRIVVRRELAELVSLNYQIAQVKYGRDFHVGWTGGYENRAIAGTNTPSNHSKGKAIDNDASRNPMSSIFQCDIPPGLVADWESTGWYWGGRYTGKTDTMHFEYCFGPGDVAGHVARARQILAAAGGQQAPAPQPAPQPAAPAPAPSGNRGPAPSAAPGFPLPGGYYYGPRSGPNNSISNQVSVNPAWKQGLATAQARLNQHLAGSGVATIAADGLYGPQTEAALRWYQTARHNAPFNLAIDGELGPATWASLWQ